jgi:transcriptional regulator with XRE-family HTH domain
MYTQWFKNLVFLREQKGESQLETATALGLSRSTYANYEAGINLPNVETVNKILGHFNIDFETFFRIDLENVRKDEKKSVENKNKKVRKGVRKHVRKEDQNSKYNLESLHAWISSEYYINSIGAVYDLDSSNDVKLIPWILKNQGDEMCMEMAALELPGLRNGIHIRVSVIEDNMHSTIKSGDKVVATYLPEPATTLREGNIYLVLDKDDGLVCRRLYRLGEDEYDLVSDNKLYKPYKRHLNDFLAVFKVVELHTRNFHNAIEDTRQENMEQLNQSG